MSFRKITVKSGNEEITMDVTKEEYQRYYRPWWRMKKKEQRNREAMEQNGYTEESYEGWKDGLTEGQEDEGPQVEGADAVIEKRELLEILGQLVREAQDQGRLRRDLPPEDLVDIFLGVYLLTQFGWEDMERCTEDERRRRVGRVLDQVLAGLAEP